MIENPTDDPATNLKDQGNIAFKNEQWTDAITAYTQAIKLGGEHHKEVATFYKNRAAAHLRAENYEQCIKDCDASLKLCATDPKALYRRSQANEALGHFEAAYRDATTIWKSNQSDKSIQPTLERLHAIVQERANHNAQSANKVTQMADILFDGKADVDKRKSAANNLLYLARDEVGADIIIEKGIVQRIAKSVKTERCEEILCNTVRTVAELCAKTPERTKKILQIVGIPWFLDVLDSTVTERVAAAQNCMQTILNAFSGLENKVDSLPVQRLCEENFNEIDTLLTCMVYSITNRTISGQARDAIVELLTRNVHHRTLNWAERLVDIKGLTRLMDVCSELEEYKYESAMDITQSSRTIAAVCMARIWDNMWYDGLRQKFMDQIDEFVKDKLLDPELEAKVRITVAMTSLLLSAVDVGNAIFSRDGIMQMVLAMATTEDLLQQKVACECIVAATTKQDKAKAIMTHGVDILKQLYRSKDEGIRVRALVGLCKLGSYGGLDASIRPFADGSTAKLSEACRRFLIKPGKDKDIRRWAVDGLAYLTLDAEVKEKLIDDRAAVQALIQLARTGDQSVLYGAVTTFVNLCNAYEKQEMVPELVELAKFAKRHIPEEHELDDPDFVHKRLTILADEGITTALVALAKTESPNSKELISRVFNALCGMAELRGKVVQQGGAKSLLPLCFNGTDKGKRQAGQALSRIGITINPEQAFPGQRSLEVIRPLLNQLHADFTALENFEALMALCNLAQVNESIRQRILKEGGLQRVEVYLMEDHLMLCRAAAQLICNMAVSEDVIKIHEKSNDRVKFLALLCKEEDEDTAMAAAGALAILTSASKICCAKLFEPVEWLDILHTLVANPSPAVQHRGAVIIYNVIESSQELAEKLLNTDIMELLYGLSQLPDDTREKARKVAQECVVAAEKRKIIMKKPGDADIPDPFSQPINEEMIGE